MGTVRKILLSHILIAKVVLTLTLTNLVMAAPQLFSTPALPSPRINEDPTGAIITVNYTAGELGYQETRERQEGAVTIKPQPAPAPGSGGAGSGLDIDSLIAQVIASLEPAIQSSVSNVLNRRG